jgi:hypothetical protein
MASGGPVSYFSHFFRFEDTTRREAQLMTSMTHGSPQEAMAGAGLCRPALGRLRSHCAPLAKHQMILRIDRSLPTFECNECVTRLAGGVDRVNSNRGR